MPYRKKQQSLSDILAILASSPSDARSSNPGRGKRGGYQIPYAEDTDRSPFRPGRRGAAPRAMLPTPEGAFPRKKRKPGQSIPTRWGRNRGLKPRPGFAEPRGVGRYRQV